MHQGMLSAATAAALLLGSLVACGTDATRAQPDAAQVGVILPDSKTSARWETVDRKYLQQAFDAAGVRVDIQNAQGDKAAFQTIADQMLTNGVSVLLLTNLDSGTGKAVTRKAKSQGVTVIDYDRLTLGGGARYFVSFDNVRVGALLAEGLATCLADRPTRQPVIAYLDGGPTDSNANLLRAGYDATLRPKFDTGGYRKGPERVVPGWDNTTAGDLFEQMLTGTPDIDGVVAANDGLAGAAIAVLRKQKLNGRIPVSGQDATIQGLQNVLSGDQCMTVYKAIDQEAAAAARLAIGIVEGHPERAEQSVRDPDSGMAIPALLLEPEPIFVQDIKGVVANGFIDKDELCAGDYVRLCADNGI